MHPREAAANARERAAESKAEEGPVGLCIPNRSPCKFGGFSLKGAYGAPLKGFGVDIKQV